MSQQQAEFERYQANLMALSECIARGVSDSSINQLAFECGVDKRDVDNLDHEVAA